MTIMTRRRKDEFAGAACRAMDALHVVPAVTLMKFPTLSRWSPGAYESPLSGAVHDTRGSPRAFLKRP